MRRLPVKLVRSVAAICFAAVMILGVSVSAGAAERTLYTVSALLSDNQLRVVNPLNGATMGSVPITLSGNATLLGVVGLSRDPMTGKLWALLVTDTTGRCQGGLGGGKSLLASIDPATGNATSVGNTGECFAGLAFAPDGTLYAVTGDGADIPEALYTLNKTTLVRTLVTALGNGNKGESIGFNPDDGLVYHASGDTDQVFESVNPNTLAVTNIPQSGAAHAEVRALTYLGQNTFLMVDYRSLYTITTGGLVTLLGNMDSLDGVVKGLAFVPKAPADLDGDAKSDVAVYETSAGNWFAIGSTAGFITPAVSFGGAGYLPVPGDYDGDGITDTAVYEESTGNWFVNGSYAGSFTAAVSFGGAGFIPVPGDYDGDGMTDVAVYNTSTGNWFAIGSTAGFFSPAVSFGGSGYIPVPGDYDGDGITDTAVYQQSTGNWFLIGSTSGFNQHLSFGGPNYFPVPGDYDGDGKTDAAVYDTTTGNWFWDGSTSGFNQHLSFGGPNFTQVPADYDGDGKTDTAVYDTTTGNWFIDQTTAGFKIVPAFGGAGYTPVLPQITILKAMGLL